MATAAHKRKPSVEACELPFVLRLHPALELSDDQFFALCQINHELRIERNAEGEMLLMPPAGGEVSRGNAEITGQLWAWARTDGTGVAFESSAGFRLANNAPLPRRRLDATSALRGPTGRAAPGIRAAVSGLRARATLAL